MSTTVDVVVIGSGPGGEVAISRLAAGGMSVALVEKELIGGECAYWACIPSKTLLRPLEARAEAADAAGLSAPPLDWTALREYRDYMIRHLDDTAQVTGYEKRGVTVIKATARLVGRNPWQIQAGDQTLTARHVVLATGSTPNRPPINGLDTVPVWTNREATNLTDIPKRALMIGGNAVGVELGQFLARMGSHVTLVQRGPRLLSREHPRVGELAAEQLRADDIDIHTDSQIRAVHREATSTLAELDDGTTLATDVIVLGAGRRPHLHGLGLDTIGVEPTASGAVPIDEHCRVTTDGLWALGDVTDIALFTHVAMYQARIVADNILGNPRQANYSGIPRVVFAQPEIAAVGHTADKAREQGFNVVSTELDLADSIARPWTYQTHPTGTLGLLADRDRRILLGAWAVAPQAGEWIHTAALAIRARIPIDTLLDSVAQFPTYSEAYLTALEHLHL